MLGEVESVGVCIRTVRKRHLLAAMLMLSMRWDLISFCAQLSWWRWWWYNKERNESRWEESCHSVLSRSKTRDMSSTWQDEIEPNHREMMCNKQRLGRNNPSTVESAFYRRLVRSITCKMRLHLRPLLVAWVCQWSNVEDKKKRERNLSEQLIHAINVRW